MLMFQSRCSPVLLGPSAAVPHINYYELRPLMGPEKCSHKDTHMHDAWKTIEEASGFREWGRVRWVWGTRRFNEGQGEEGVRGGEP